MTLYEYAYYCAYYNATRPFFSTASTIGVKSVMAARREAHRAELQAIKSNSLQCFWVICSLYVVALLRLSYVVMLSHELYRAYSLFCRAST